MKCTKVRYAFADHARSTAAPTPGCGWEHSACWEDLEQQPPQQFVDHFVQTCAWCAPSRTSTYRRRKDT